MATRIIPEITFALVNNLGYRRDKKMKKDAVTKLLDEIERILKRDGSTVADLARDIGRSYHQTFMWVRSRRFNPRADADGATRLAGQA